MPCPCGPRHCGQFSAAEVVAVAATSVRPAVKRFKAVMRICITGPDCSWPVRRCRRWDGEYGTPESRDQSPRGRQREFCGLTAGASESELETGIRRPIRPILLGHL